jgi:hypothetical protein
MISMLAIVPRKKTERKRVLITDLQEWIQNIQSDLVLQEFKFKMVSRNISSIYMSTRKNWNSIWHAAWDRWNGRRGGI